MLIVKIIGGLGNQMFQYAYAKALQEKGYKVKLDISAYETYKLHGGYQLNKYNIDMEIAKSKEIEKLAKKNIFEKIMRKKKKLKEKNHLFDINLLQPDDEKYIVGYFQSEQYFIDIRKKILEDFVIKQKLSNYSSKVKGQILGCQNALSIHIRRGDYITNKNANQRHGTCSLNYYQEAYKRVSEMYGIMDCFVFSDDISWAKENLDFANTEYIASAEEQIPHEDIYLMSLCKHNIIANSSFSWWGAWLNENEAQCVIAPKQWIQDKQLQAYFEKIVPEHWIKM